MCSLPPVYWHTCSISVPRWLLTWEQMLISSLEPLLHHLMITYTNNFSASKLEQRQAWGGRSWVLGPNAQDSSQWQLPGEFYDRQMVRATCKLLPSSLCLFFLLCLRVCWCCWLSAWQAAIATLRRHPMLSLWVYWKLFYILLVKGQTGRGVLLDSSQPCSTQPLSTSWSFFVPDCSFQSSHARGDTTRCRKLGVGTEPFSLLKECKCVWQILGAQERVCVEEIWWHVL